MKKILFAALALAAAGSSMAAPTNPRAVPVAESAPKASYTYELGLSTHREVYEEFASGGKLMQETAVMTSLVAGVSRAIGDTGGSVELRGQVSLVGKADYTGAYMGGEYGSVYGSGQHRHFLDVTAMYKQTAPEWSGVTAGAGIGYRRLQDNLQELGPGGYERINHRIYLTASLERAFEFTNWTITPGVQYKHTISSKQKSDLAGGVSNKQPTGPGGEVSVAVIEKGARYNSILTVFYRGWNTKDSDVDAATGLYEPRNKTKEIGVAATYKF
jgi:hypothetical protein